MRRIGAVALLTALALGLPSCLHQTGDIPLDQIAPSSLDYLLIARNRMTHDPSVKYLVADFDGDSLSDCLTIHSLNDKVHNVPPFITYSNIYLENGTPQLNFEEADNIEASAFDVDADGKMEIFVFMTIGDSLFVKILVDKGNKRQGPYFLATGTPRKKIRWEGYAQPIDVLHVADSTYVVFRIHTGYSYQPRGLLFMNLASGSRLEKRCGAQLNDITKVDLDKDGLNEYLCGTSTPDNCDGIEVNNTDDRHAYMFVSSFTDNIKLHEKLSENPGTSELFFLPQTDSTDTIFLVSYAGKLDSSFIGLYNYTRRQWLKKELFADQSIEKPIVQDVNLDGKPEILFSYTNGRIEIRNSALELIHSQNIGLRKPTIKCYDINQDGRKEIFAYTEGTLYAFSSKLHLLAKGQIEFDQFDTVKTPEGNGWFVQASQFSAFIVLEPNTALAQNNVRQIIKGLLLGISLVLVAVLGKKWYNHRQIPYLAHHALQNMEIPGVLIIDRNGLIQQLNEKAKLLLGITQFRQGTHYKSLLQDRLPQILSVVECHLKKKGTSNNNHKLPATLDATPNLQVTARPLMASGEKFKGLLLLMDDRSEQIQAVRAIAWSSMAQRLAHQIKTPLASVLLAVQRLQMEYAKEISEKTGVYDRYIDYVTGEVGRIRQAIDGFLKLARLEKPVMRTCHVNDLITLALQKFAPHVRDDIRIDKALADDLPAIEMDDNQILIVMNILLENSLEAMPQGGYIFISTGLAHNLQKHVRNDDATWMEVVISDSGIGIADCDKAKIFEPFHTTKPNGTGLGLSIARKIIEEHGGTIDLKSTVHIGTRVTIRLPLDH
jgi:nitrogen-specific signal transduction histidine kinase